MALKTLVLNVPEMSTEHCLDDVLRASYSVEGVSKADASLDDKTVTIEFDDALASENDFIQAIDAQGYQADPA